MKRLELTAVLLLCHVLSFTQSPSCALIHTTLAAPVKGLPGVGIKIFNNYTARNLSNLALEWEVVLNGTVVQKGKVPLLTVAPQHSGALRLPVKTPAAQGELLLNIYYRLKKTGGLSPAGSLIAWEQLSLREYNDDLSVRPAGELSFTDEGGTFTIVSPATNLNLQFNKQTGWLQHYAMGDRRLAEDSSGLITRLGHDTAGAEPRLQLFSTSTSTDLAVVKADYLLPETPFLLHARYTVNARGEMRVEQFLEVDTTQPRDTTIVQPPLKYPPLFGMKWGLPAGFDSVLYYGRVPLKDADSCHDARIGIYRGGMEDTGARMGVRWWKCTDAQGHGLLIAADSTLLDMRLSGSQLNIDHPAVSAGTGSYHYIYKVTPQ